MTRSTAIRWGLVLAAGLTSATLQAQSFFKNAPPRLTVSVDAPAKPPGAAGPIDLPVRIAPNPGIHVYAPGNPEYIPISIEITPSPGLTADAARFPKAEDFFFAALAESVKVYSKPFVVVVPLHAASTLAGKAAQDGTIAISGVVKYQACDDKLCFPPQSASFEARLPVAAKRR